MTKNFKRTIAFLLTLTMVISCMIMNFSLTTSADTTESKVIANFDNGVGSTTIEFDRNKYGSNNASTGLGITTSSSWAKSNSGLRVMGPGLKGSGYSTTAKVYGDVHIPYTHTEGYNGISFWLKVEQPNPVVLDVRLENLESGQKVSLKRLSVASQATAGKGEVITALYQDARELTGLDASFDSAAYATFVPSKNPDKNRITLRFQMHATTNTWFYVDEVYEVKEAIEIPDEVTDIIEDFNDFEDADLENILTSTTSYSSDVKPTFSTVNDFEGAAGKSLKVTVPKATAANAVRSYTCFEYYGVEGYDGISFRIKADTTIKLEVRIQRGAQTEYALGRVELGVGATKEVRVRYDEIRAALSLNANPGDVIDPPYSFVGGPLYVKFYIHADTSMERGFTIDDIKQYKKLLEDTQQTNNKVIENFESGTVGIATTTNSTCTTNLTAVEDPRDPSGHALRVEIPMVSDANKIASYVNFDSTYSSSYQGVSFWIKAETPLTFEIRIRRGAMTEFSLRRVSLKAGEATKITAFYDDVREAKTLENDEGAKTSWPANYRANGYAWTVKIYAHGTRANDRSYIVDDVEFFNPTFTGASLSLSDDIGLNYKVNPADLAGHTATVEFEQGGNTTIVDKYTEDNGRYVYRFENIDPSKMNETITSTLKLDGTAVATKTYSVAEYCYTMMRKKADNAKLCNLLADILEYGAKAQLYLDHNTDNLPTALLPSQYKDYISRELNVDDLDGVTQLITPTADVETPSASWKAVSLYLDDAVNIRLTFQTTLEDATAITAKVTSKALSPVTISSDKIESNGGGLYTFLIEDVDASHVRDVFSVVLYNEGTPISNTVSYSVETYAKAKMKGSDAALADLMEALIKYGDSVNEYVS